MEILIIISREAYTCHTRTCMVLYIHSNGKAAQRVLEYKNILSIDQLACKSKFETNLYLEERKLKHILRKFS